MLTPTMSLAYTRNYNKSLVFPPVNSRYMFSWYAIQHKIFVFATYIQLRSIRKPSKYVWKIIHFSRFHVEFGISHLYEIFLVYFISRIEIFNGVIYNRKCIEIMARVNTYNYRYIISSILDLSVRCHCYRSIYTK